MRIATDKHVVFEHAVAFDCGIFRNLSTVAQRRNGIFITAGHNARFAVDFGTVAHPDIILLIAFQQGEIKHLGPMFNKRELNDGIAINLCLVDHARMGHRGAIINLQYLLVIRRKALRRDNFTAV